MATIDNAHLGGDEVLLVEDDSGDAFLVEELLMGVTSDLTTVWAPTLAEAIDRMTTRTVCILMDLGLPDATGLDGLRRFIDIAGRVPVIVFTGRADRELGEVAVAEGAQDYIVKGSVGGEGLLQSIRYAIERKRGQETAKELHEAQLVAAEKSRLERGLLPRPILRNPRLKWASRYRPGGGRALLGGDFYDGIELDDGTIRVLIGDVTGHGPDEAALGVALRVAWRTLVLSGSQPDQVLKELQRMIMLERHHEDVFATICDVSIDASLSKAELRLGGHPCPLILQPPKAGEVALPARGPLVGLIENAVWPKGEVDLGDDWALILYTDGIIEGRTEGGERLDMSGLIQLASEGMASGFGLGGLADFLISQAEAANGGPLPDDTALFLLAVGDRW